jgi:hypothetical protein
MNETLRKLREDKFIYCNKTYIRDRFIIDDNKALVTFDDLYFYSLFMGTEDGLCRHCTHELSERNIHAYPYYTMEDILSLYRDNKDKFIHNIKVHPSQYKRK